MLLLIAVFVYFGASSEKAFAQMKSISKDLAGLRKSGAETPVAQVMRADIPTVPESMLFDRAYAVLKQHRCPALPVLDSGGRLVGLFTPENVGEMIMVQSAIGSWAP